MRRVHALIACALFAIPADAQNDPLYRSVFCDDPGPVEFVLRTALAKRISLEEATNVANVALESGFDSLAPCGFGYYAVKDKYELGEFTISDQVYAFIEAEVTAITMDTMNEYEMPYLKRIPLAEPMFLYTYKWKGTK